MQPDTMRNIDQWLGPPICFLLTCVRRIASLFKARLPDGPVKNAKRVLFVKPAEMGSTVLTYSALLRARELWPDCQIYFLVFTDTRKAVDLLPQVPRDNVFEIRSDNLISFVVDSFRQLARIRSLKFDVALDLEFFSRGASILAFLTGARFSCGFERFAQEGLYKGDLVTHPVIYNPHIHTAASFVMLVEAFNQDRTNTPLVKAPPPSKESLKLPPFEASVEEKKRLWEIIKQQNPNVSERNRLVILNANASDLMPLRKWPAANYIALARKLLEQPDIVIVFTGVASEAAEAETMMQELGRDRCVNLAGKTDIRSLVVLYTISALMVTNDSGPSHFACLTDLPAITLFGPETPEIYGPLGKNKVTLVSGLACSPCVSSYTHRRSYCTDNVCMKSIRVDEVYEICCKLLPRSSG